MDISDLLACQYHSWYPIFRQVCYNTEIVELSQGFVDYLQQDGIFLPDGTDALPVRSRPNADDTSPMMSEEEEDEEEDADTIIDWTRRFPLEAQQIEEAISRLGGNVVPKLNWSCPTDATWLSTSGLRCSSAAQVVLLLKSSDRVAHDLEVLQQATAPGAAHPPPVMLALTKWRDVRPERQFRCFVRRHQLVAVSQRDPTQLFPQLANELQRIQPLVEGFHVDHVRDRFPLPNYTYDVYVTASAHPTVRLLDFNPVGGTTQPLLFNWEELGLLRGGPPDRHHASAAVPGPESLADAPSPATGDLQNGHHDHPASVPGRKEGQGGAADVPNAAPGENLLSHPTSTTDPLLCGHHPGQGGVTAGGDSRRGQGGGLQNGQEGDAHPGQIEELQLGQEEKPNGAGPSMAGSSPVVCATETCISSTLNCAMHSNPASATSGSTAATHFTPTPSSSASRSPTGSHDRTNASAAGSSDHPDHGAANERDVQNPHPAKSSAAGPPVQWRIVQGSAGVSPGQRSACAMPYDMLMLQETVDGIVDRMRRQSP